MRAARGVLRSALVDFDRFFILFFIIFDDTIAYLPRYPFVERDDIIIVGWCARSGEGADRVFYSRENDYVTIIFTKKFAQILSTIFYDLCNVHRSVVEIVVVVCNRGFSFDKNKKIIGHYDDYVAVYVTTVFCCYSLLLLWWWCWTRSREYDEFFSYVVILP